MWDGAFFLAVDVRSMPWEGLPGELVGALA